MKPGVRSTPEEPARPKAGETSDLHPPDASVELPPASDEPETAPEPAAAPAVDFKDKWLRTEADFQNYRRRAQRDLEETRRDAEERVLLDLIAALDDLERALTAAREAEAPESWLAGVELVATRMRETLARRGVAPIEALGEPFDPAFHEALLEIDPPPGAAPGTVASVVLQGYRRGDRVLRPARVVVARRDAAKG